MRKLSASSRSNGPRHAAAQKEGLAGEAQAHFAAARDIIAKLIAQNPDWAQLKEDLAEIDSDIAALRAPTGAKP
jgi:hypothetical protein